MEEIVNVEGGSSGSGGSGGSGEETPETAAVIRRNDEVGKLRFRVNEVNWEERTMMVDVIGNAISERYKMIRATLTIIPRGDRTPSRVAWTVEFEKIGLNDLQDPDQIIDTLTNLIQKIDRNLYQQDNNFNSMYVESTAVECFKAIHEAFKDDADVEIKAQDWENKTITLSLRSTHVLMTNNMIKVTVIVTPHREDDDGSLVQWIFEMDNGGFISYLDLPDIRGMIKNKLRK